MKENSKLHYGWLVVIAMIAIQGGIYGILINCAGIIMSAIKRDMGFRAGDISIYYTVRALAQAATVGITTKMFFDKNSKAFMSMMGVIGGVSFIAMAMFNHLWQWYISAVFMGISMSCVFVVIPVIINNWFKEKNGLVIGISMASSGIVGAIFSPIISSMIESFGWRKASVLTGIIAIAMVVIPTFLFMTNTPEEKGMKPYGYKDQPKQEETKTDVKPEAVSYNVPAIMFVICLVSLIAGGVMTQFNNQLPVFATTLGYTLATGAIITSCSMIGNVAGKLLMGAMADKIGVFKSMYIILSTVTLSMAMLLMGKSSVMLMYVGSLLYGLCFSFGSTVPSLVFLDVYGPAAYRDYLSRFLSINSVVLALASSLLPYIYDFTGSFKPVLLLGIAVNVVAILSAQYIQKKSKQLKESN